MASDPFADYLMNNPVLILVIIYLFVKFVKSNFEVAEVEGSRVIKIQGMNQWEELLRVSQQDENSDDADGDEDVNDKFPKYTIDDAANNLTKEIKAAQDNEANAANNETNFQENEEMGSVAQSNTLTKTDKNVPAGKAESKIIKRADNKEEKDKEGNKFEKKDKLDLVVLLFFKNRNTACRKAAPLYGELSQRYDQNDVVFAKCNVDFNWEIKTSYKIDEEVMTLPYVKIFHESESVDYLTGFDVEEIVNKLSKYGAVAGPPKAPPRQDATWGPPKRIPADPIDDEMESKKAK